METDDTIAAAMATLDRAFERASATIMPDEYAKRDGVEDSRLEMGETLGEGGMGIVRVAKQAALGREVAVKTLRGEHSGDIFTRRLLQEAWTTGALEHPNVVPVYDIQRSPDGTPLIVLKRIEGREWTEALASKSDDEDVLEDHLRTLMQVCRAIHFAHRRGFVHRDIKPENVMIGEFGETYVLDWGISVAMQDDGTGRFPLASDARAMAGTPAYMAPEMLGGDEPRIGPWTDIYLLGAVLYEIIAGHAPHHGEGLPEILRSVIAGPQACLDQGPELWRICARAMDNDPEARFETAEQFRLAIEGYLNHRGARRIARRAEASLHVMRDALEKDDHETVESAFAECRFGFRAAIEAWSEYGEAKENLGVAEMLMASAELRAGRPDAARRIIAASDATPSDALVQSVRSALEKDQLEKAKVEKWRADQNEDTGRRTRTFVISVVALSWIGGPFLRPYFYSESRFSTVGLYLLAALTVGGLLFWARDSLSRSKVNRTFAALLGAVVVSNLVVSVVAAASGLEPVWVEQTMPFVWLTAALVAMWTVSFALWPSVIAFAGVCLATVRFPEWRNQVTAAANVLLFINAFWVNRGLRVLREMSADRRSRRPQKGE